MARKAKRKKIVIHIDIEKTEITSTSKSMPLPPELVGHYEEFENFKESEEEQNCPSFWKDK